LAVKVFLSWFTSVFSWLTSNTSAVSWAMVIWLLASFNVSAPSLFVMLAVPLGLSVISKPSVAVVSFALAVKPPRSCLSDSGN